MAEAPSKYHRKCFIGRNIQGADEHGNSYEWDSSHEELAPTSIVEINSTPYCSYCCSKAYPIQPYVYTYSDYKVTGHTCTCAAAEAEKQYKLQLEELESKHYDEKQKLKDAFRDSLAIDKLAILKVKHRAELRRAELHRSEGSTDSYFSSVNGDYIYQ